MRNRIPQTKKGALLCTIAELHGIIATVRAFRRKCRAAEQTDTGEAWEVLNDIANSASLALRELRRADPGKLAGEALARAASR